MRTHLDRFRWLAAGIAALVLLVSCSSVPVATPTSTKTPKPLEQTIVGQSGQQQPTQAAGTAVPAATPRPAQPTPTTAPAGLSATPTATPLAIQGLIGPDSYDANVDPLTGLPVADPATLNRRPLAVKISNSPAQYVRPHSGLDKADLVFEHYAEGAVTRLTAIFYSQGAAQVGSVRSARMIDLELPAMYQSAFAYSGSSAGVKAKIRNSDFFDRVISPDFGYGEPYFYRMPREGVPFEHTLFANLFDIWAWLEGKGNNQRPELKGLGFTQAPPSGGTPAGTVMIGYLGPDTLVKWVYVPGTGRYLRWQGGVAHTVIDGTQLSTANVVVVGAHHQDTDILEDTVAGGHYSIEIQLWGEGPASLFRDGQRYEGRWRRANRADMLTFTDLQGNLLPLKPGNTWFQLVPLGFTQLTTEP